MTDPYRGPVPDDPVPDDPAPYGPVEVFAHRGFSGRHPEMTRGAFEAAIDLARTRGVRLGVECDVHFTADGELGCLHDLDLSRTAGIDAALVDLRLDELAAIDFGRWREDLAEIPEQDRRFISLRELFVLLAQARAQGVDVHVAVETKHPVPRDDQVEVALAGLLAEFGWDGPDAPVRMITFDPAALVRMRQLVPNLALTYLIAARDAWPDPRIGTDIAVGPGAHLLALDPGLAGEILAAGHACHVWTVDDPGHIRAALGLGITAITSDHPDRVLDEVHRATPQD